MDKLLTIIAACRAHDDQWRRGYAPYLSTWLTDRRWEDQILQREKGANAAETGPVAEKTQSPALPAKATPQVPPEKEKAVRELCAAFAALWPAPVNDSLVRAFFMDRRAPSPDALRGRVTDYLAAAAAAGKTRDLSLFDGLMYCHCQSKDKDQDHARKTASQPGENRISGLQAGNRKAA
jgi:hypothetical protein